eukprot:Gb_28715 [translate_table: standard]
MVLQHPENLHIDFTFWSSLAPFVLAVISSAHTGGVMHWSLLIISIFSMRSSVYKSFRKFGAIKGAILAPHDGGAVVITRLTAICSMPQKDCALVDEHISATGFSFEELFHHLLMHKLLVAAARFESDHSMALAPYIGFGIYWEIAKLWISGARVIILDVPLLFEAKINWLTKPIIVVWVDPASQLQRLMVRDGISEEQASNRIRAQLPLDWKRERADIVIDNSGPLEATKDQIHDIVVHINEPLTWKEYLRSRTGVLSIMGAVAFGILAWIKY